MPTQEFTKPLPQSMFVREPRWAGLLHKLQVILSLLDRLAQLVKPVIRCGTQAGAHDSISATVFLPYRVEKPRRFRPRKLDPLPIVIDAIEPAQPFGRRGKRLRTL